MQNYNSAVSQKLRKTGKLQGALSAIRNERPGVFQRICTIVPLKDELELQILVLNVPTDTILKVTRNS